MRPIKFRVWDKHIAEMFYDVGIIGNDLFIRLDGSAYDTVGEYTDDGFHVMQYAGLKDKNGREIYEGDIFQLKSLYIDLETGNQHIETECIPVIFERGAFFLYERGIKHHSLYDILRGFGQGESSNEWGTEVVGNIYEDKHLLEVQT